MAVEALGKLIEAKAPLSSESGGEGGQTSGIVVEFRRLRTGNCDDGSRC